MLRTFPEHETVVAAVAVVIFPVIRRRVARKAKEIRGRLDLLRPLPGTKTGSRYRRFGMDGAYMVVSYHGGARSYLYPLICLVRLHRPGERFRR